MKSNRSASFKPVGSTYVDSTQLWRAYHSHGPGHVSENDLVSAYLHLVKTLVGRLAMNLPSHVDMEDLHSAGLIGLLNAVRNFDPKKGAPFEPYARMRIRGAALDELRRMDWVPRSVHRKARQVQAAMSELEHRLGRLPTEEEMARELQLSMDQYLKLVDEIKPATFICLDANPAQNESDLGPEACALPCDSGDDTREAVSSRELAVVIQKRIRELPDTHRKVLALYYHEDLRLREIAELLGLCESRICQIHTQSILSIRGYLQRLESGSNPSSNRIAA